MELVYRAKPGYPVILKIGATAIIKVFWVLIKTLKEDNPNCNCYKLTTR